jgi:hypothetical protein
MYTDAVRRLSVSMAAVFPLRGMSALRWCRIDGAFRCCYLPSFIQSVEIARGVRGNFGALVRGRGVE